MSLTKLEFLAKLNAYRTDKGEGLSDAAAVMAYVAKQCESGAVKPEVAYPVASEYSIAQAAKQLAAKAVAPPAASPKYPPHLIGCECPDLSVLLADLTWRQNSTGSYGWGVSDKVRDAWGRSCQVGITVTVANSGKCPAGTPTTIDAALAAKVITQAQADARRDAAAAAAAEAAARIAKKAAKAAGE